MKPLGFRNMMKMYFARHLFAENQEIFMDYLPDSGAILDFGCGFGRDTKYFLRRGFTGEVFNSISVVR